ncbi:hypothetical protein [Streptomyces bluensis]|uniref:hypothetical protein n=1 Tax=Streptomyces bluensis TaxID=33897 RepID=UPI00369B848C
MSPYCAWTVRARGRARPRCNPGGERVQLDAVTKAEVVRAGFSGAAEDTHLGDVVAVRGLLSRYEQDGARLADVEHACVVCVVCVVCVEVVGVGAVREFATWCRSL